MSRRGKRKVWLALVEGHPNAVNSCLTVDVIPLPPTRGVEEEEGGVGGGAEGEEGVLVLR
jgi:hypothetical protein